MDIAKLCDCSIYKYPCSFIDRNSEPILIKPLDEARHEPLASMYLRCVPRNSFGGLPPAGDDACRKWVGGMIAGAANLIAVSFERGIIGHACLFPMGGNRCEFLVVVAPDFRGRGVGTHLTRCAAQLACEAGFEQIWLSVEVENHVARHVYLKC